MLGKITDKIEDYAENKIELIKLEFEEKMSKATEGIIKIIVLSISCLMFILFITLALAFMLNDLFNSLYAGFLIIASVYLLLFLVIYFNKDHKVFKNINLLDLK